MKRIIAAFFNSVAGLRHGFSHETAIREELIVLAVSIPVAPLIARDLWHLLLLWSVLLLLLLTELLNTGIEQVANKVTREYADEIRFAKDCGSAAVLMAILIAVGVWALSLSEYFGWLQV